MTVIAQPTGARVGGQRFQTPLRHGFTLLEVVLALALSVLVLAVLGFAIQLNLQATNSGRGDVAQAQLARALLDRMAGDLRGAVWYKPPDTSAMMPLVKASTNSGGGSGSTSSGGNSSSSGGGSNSGQNSGNGGGSGGGTGTATGGGSGSGSSGGVSSGGAGSSGRSGTGSGSGSSGSSASSGGSSSSSGSQSSSSSASSDSTTSNAEETPPARFYGGSDWIEFDATRFPSSSAYAESAANSVTATFGDVRNVAWYLASGTASTSGFTAPDGAAGVLRREADGAIARFASDNGGLSLLDQSAETLAPEVAALQFSYFDGTQWLTEWDSDAIGGPPVAVEIAIALIDPSAPPPAQPFSFATAASEQPGYRVYRKLVHLPMASPAAESSTSTQLSEESSGSSSSGSSSSGSSSSTSGQGAQ